MTTTKADGPDFASSSLPRHLARGVIGFGALIGSVALIPTVGPVSLLLLPLGVLALRGCPMCWTIAQDDQPSDQLSDAVHLPLRDRDRDRDLDIAHPWPPPRHGHADQAQRTLSVMLIGGTSGRNGDALVAV